MFDADEDDDDRHALIRLIDLPGVAEIEALLVKAQATNGKNWQWCQHHDDAEKLARQVSMRLFGIAEAETHYVEDEGRSREDNDNEGGCWESHFRGFVQGSQPWPWARWEDLDWDVNGSDGEPLRALKFFYRQIVAVERGLCGRLPGEKDPGLSPSEEQFIEDRLKAEAAKFRRSG
jgi:hypothetical protein